MKLAVQLFSHVVSVAAVVHTSKVLHGFSALLEDLIEFCVVRRAKVCSTRLTLRCTTKLGMIDTCSRRTSHPSRTCGTGRGRSSSTSDFKVVIAVVTQLNHLVVTRTRIISLSARSSSVGNAES